MKKILFALLFILLFSTVVFAQERAATDAFAGRIGKHFETVLDSVGKIIGGLFRAVSTNPFVWLRFLMFVVIFAILNYSTKKIQLFEDKTSAIVAFVIAFATVAIIPAWVLVGVVSVYGGLILLGLIAVPLYFMVHVTRTVRKNNVNLFFLFVSWVVFGALVASINDGSQLIKGPLFTGPIMTGPFMSDAAFKSLTGIVETSLEFIVLGCIITAIVLFFWWLFNVGTGTTAGTGGAAPARGGGGWLDEVFKPFKTSFKKLWEPTLAAELEAIANIEGELKAATGKAGDDFKDYINTALSELKKLSKATDDIKDRVAELIAYREKFSDTEQDKIDQMNIFARSVSKDLKEIKNSLTNASKEVSHADAKDTIDDVLEQFKKIVKNILELQRLERALDKKINP